MDQAPKTKNYGLWLVLNAACAAWLVYDMATAAEPPTTVLMALQWALLAGTVVGAIGYAAMLMRGASSRN